MYNEILLQETMAERGWNWYQLALKAKVDPKTAKAIVTTGKGRPVQVRRIVETLGLTMKRAVKRHPKVM